MNDLEKKFVSVLKAALQNKASDVHLATNQPPAIRSSDGLLPVSLPPFTAEEMNIICQFMVTDPKVKAGFAESQDIDGSFEVKGLARFRFNIYKTGTGRSAVLRVINPKVPTIDELKLPDTLRKIADAARGLILVTGATGSGKSSTLAAMIDYLNENQALHILTIEDPVEFVHPQKKSRMSQREIGKDTSSFAVALKSALRQDPDVILVGEMRDIETLDIALKAAETGHLVFSTVHTSDAMKTIGRLISLYPAAEQNGVRIRLADNLHAVISQRLVPAIAGGKVVAQEILINNLGIQECIINEKKTFEIPGFIEKGREVSGMQTFDQHLADLVNNQQISMETALEYATNANDFQRAFSFAGAGDDKETPAGGDPSMPGMITDMSQGGISLEGEVQEPTAPPAHTPPPPMPRVPSSKTGMMPMPSFTKEAGASGDTASIDLVTEGDEPTSPGLPKLPKTG